MVSCRCVTSLIMTTLSIVHSVSADRLLPTLGDARLRGGTNFKGRAEVWTGAEVGRGWRTICDDYWSLEEGDVVCRQLGFTAANRVYRGPDVRRKFGSTARDIFLDDLRCRGNETNLFECNRSREPHNCVQSQEMAGVECIQTSGIRLVLDGLVNDRIGFVEVSINGEWGMVCDDEWNRKSATVACRELGRELSMTNPNIRQSSDRLLRYVIDDINCQGDEGRLLDCGRRPLWTSNCGANEAAAVACS